MDATYCAVTEATQQEEKGELNAANVNSIGAVMSSVRSALEMYKFLHVTEVGGRQTNERPAFQGLNQSQAQPHSYSSMC